MERIFWVKNGNLEVVNDWLEHGGRVKSIYAVPEVVSAYGYTSNGTLADEKGRYVGDIYAYVVVEIDDHLLK